jgi:hypothetical protein
MIWTTILRWLTGDLASALTRWREVELKARNESERLVAQAAIEEIKGQIASRAEAASVVKEGMQHKVFWIPWLLAAVPTALWFGWGMLDSLCNGALPDVAKLPPQLERYADIVFANIFYVGAGGLGVQAIANAIRGRR